MQWHCKDDLFCRWYSDLFEREKRKDKEQLLYKLALIWKHFKLVSYVAEVWKLNIPKHFLLFFSGMISKRWISCDSPRVKPRDHWACLILFWKKRLGICTDNAQLWRALRFIFYSEVLKRIQKKTFVISVLCSRVACCKIYLCFTKMTTQLTLEEVRGRPAC